MHLSQEAAVSAQMHSTASEHLSRKLQRNKKNTLYLNVQCFMERFMEFKAESDGLLLRLNDYNVSKKHL